MNREGKPNYAFIDSQNLHIGVKESSWVIDYIKLRNYNYILVFKPVLGIRKGSKLEYKGNVDAELVLHTMINFNKYEKAIIVSGDGDFHCLIEYLYQKKKLEKILTPNKKYSSLLKIYSRYIVSLDTLKAKLEKRGIPAGN